MVELFIAFIFGSVFGSFLNVCIYRLPKDSSIVTPASFCPNCKTPIKWYDNIPILSFIILGAKCRSCKTKISFRYPIVELITAAIFVAMYYKFGISLAALKFIIFFCLLVVVSFIDIDYHAIPAYLCFIGITIGCIFSIWETTVYMKSNSFNWQDFPVVKAFYALIFGFGFSYLFKFFGDILLNIYLSWRKKDSIEGETEALGLGDVDFMGMVGVFLSIKAVVLTFFLAPLFALAYALIAVIFKKSHLIPYLPYLSLGAVATFFWGDRILRLVFYY